MNANTQNLLDQIVADRIKLKKKMIWEADSDAMAMLSAFLFASEGKVADVDRYVECKKYFQKNVNIFSEMRGLSQVIVITKMCLSDNYEEYLAGAMEVYKKLRKLHKLTASPYMVMAALNIYEGGGVEKADENIEKLENIYKEMKADHFWLTGDEDRPFLGMLVSRDVDVSAISNEVSRCYEASKKMSFSKEAMHTTAQIMAVSGKSVDEKVSDLKETMEAIKAHKIKGVKHELMPLAAALGLINASPDEKAVCIKENYDYLKTQKGFKWYIGNTQRTFYSILAYALLNIDEDKAVLNSVISATITNIIIDEIIMMMLVSTAVNTSRSTSSSSS